MLLQNRCYTVREHEAAHSVAAYLVAPEIEIPFAESIYWIQVGGFEGTPDAGAAGVTCFCTYGRSIRRFNDNSRNMGEVIATARANGLGTEVDRWAHAHALIGVAGFAMQSVLTGRPFESYWNCMPEVGDRPYVADVCAAAGLDVHATTNAAVRRATELFLQPPVRAAVQALADRLCFAVRMPGTQATEIIAEAMGCASANVLHNGNS